MSQYNQSERKIARYLNNFPWLKTMLKRSYQYLNFFFYKKEYKVKTIYDLVAVEYDNHETFFGYYDKSPENKTGDYLIFHATEYPTIRLPNPDVPVKIVLFNRDQNSKYIFKSLAYNWQQGCRLQWLNELNFIFNDFDIYKQKYISKIVDARDAKIIAEIPYPINDTFQNLALTLNYSRLFALRPDYGYSNIKHFSLDDDADGVFIGNLATGELKLLYSLSAIKTIQHQPVFKHAMHKVNHIMISPGGDKFIFMHRYLIKGRRFDRLMLGYMDGRTPIVLSRYSMVSHCFWLDNTHVVAFLEDAHGEGYYIIDTISFSINPLSLNILSSFGDGHPNVKGNKMIFDTYPDKARMKSLFLFQMDRNELKLLGEFYESLKYNGQTRCDLHPRWNYGGDKIFIDSVHEGKRKLYFLKITMNE